MDTLPVLTSLAAVLPAIPESDLDQQLVAFDSLLNVSDPGVRLQAAELVRQAAANSPSPSHRDRLLRAAAAIAAGQPSGRTPDGRTAAEAAARQTVTADQWAAMPPLPEPADADDDEDEDEEVRPDFIPPDLPTLRVSDFFPGLMFRVARDFTDAQGRAFRTADVHTVLSKPEGGNVTLYIRSLHVSDPEILENTGNRWFQPIPTVECLSDLCEALETEIGDLLDGDPNEETLYALDTLDFAVDDVAEWLAAAEPEEPPMLEGLEEAVETLGPSHGLVRRAMLLAEGVNFIEFAEA